MAIGNIPTNRLLGVANLQAKEAHKFANLVLNMPADVPVYQQQLVHADVDRGGGPALGEAAICGTPDSEQSNDKTIREISGGDTPYARRNLSGGKISLNKHRTDNVNQIYYLNNEPEISGQAQTTPSDCTKCANPRGFDVDTEVSAYGTAIYYELSSNAQIFSPSKEEGCNTVGDVKRISPLALAYTYLKVRSDTDKAGKGHCVLPPSATSAVYDNSIIGSYYTIFYDAVLKNGVKGLSKINPSDLKVFHAHQYAQKISDVVRDWKFSVNPPVFTPLSVVAITADQVRKGYAKFTQTYSSPPLDILLSETGPSLDGLGQPASMAGWWDNWRQGLSWWNSYLFWLTRSSRLLGGSDGLSLESYGKSLYALMHDTSTAPFIWEGDTNSSRAVSYLYAENQYPSRLVSSDTKACDPNFKSDGSTRITGNPLYADNTNSFYKQWYQPMFHSQNVSDVSDYLRNQITNTWGNKTWRRTPFSACLSVWSKIGRLSSGIDYEADEQNQKIDALNSKWKSSKDKGLAGRAYVTIPEGGGTVYFTMVKYDYQYAYAPGDYFTLQWTRQTGPNAPYYAINYGYLPLDDMPNSELFNIPGVMYQHAYSAMVFPVVIYSRAECVMKVELFRAVGGTGVWLAPPVVLPGYCTWLGDRY